jgi:hypothetical protein
MDPRFFRKYLDILSEAPVSTPVASNTPVKLPAPSEPGGYQSLDDKDYEKWTQYRQAYTGLDKGTIDDKGSPNIVPNIQQQDIDMMTDLQRNMDQTARTPARAQQFANRRQKENEYYAAHPVKPD